MSTGAQVAVLDARGVRQSRSQAELHPTERPAVRIVAFGGLALYGALRWGTMLNPAPVLRLLGLVAVAIAVASFGRELRAYLRPLAVIVAVIATIAIFPLAGIPFSWVRHVRIAVTADAIDQGLVALPRALVPYTGINEWVRLVIVLGAGVLLLPHFPLFPVMVASQMLNGVLLPFVLIFVVLLMNDKELMGEYVNSRG